MRGADARLVKRARAGDARAVDALFDAHWARVWRIAAGVTGSRSVGEDVAQEAFVKAFGALDRFDLDRPFAPWIGQIALRCGLDANRRRAATVPLDGIGEPQAPTVPDGASDVRRAVASLGEERRTVVALYYWAGLPVSEIADLLGIAVGTAASRLQRGIEELRARYGEGVAS